MQEKLKEKTNVGALSVRNTRKNLPNCAQKGNKGITLVALIITIIVLLILAVVAIRAVQGDGIISKAKESQTKYTKGQAEEQIKIALNEWKILGNIPNSETLEEFLIGKFGAENVEENEDGTYTVYIGEYEAIIDANGNIVGEVEKSGPRPVIENIKVVENSDGTGDALGEKSIEDTSKKLYITFTHKMPDGGTTTVSPALPYEVSQNGTYNFTVTGPNGETKKVSVTVNQYKILLKIGDKVNYDEGYDAEHLKTSTVASSFVMKNLEWRVLDIEEDGTVELISTQPTDSKLTLSGQQDWLDAEIKLDTLCNDLYANGAGVTARSLKVEDVNKLANNYNPSTYRDYGVWWRYKYDADETVNHLQYSTSSNYNPVTKEGTWTEYANTTNTYESFTEPGKATINSANYQDAEGNPIVAELQHTYYSYSVSSEVPSTLKTPDGILMSALITQGLDDANTKATGSNINQWLSSRCVNCYSSNANFRVHYLILGSVNGNILWNSTGGASSPSCAVRPVVSLPSNAQLTRDDAGVWQVNL